MIFVSSNKKRKRFISRQYEKMNVSEQLYSVLMLCNFAKVFEEI